MADNTCEGSEPHPNGVILEGETGGRDENGICSATVIYSASAFSDVLTVGADDYEGLVETTRSWTALNDGTGSYTVAVTYKGYVGGGESGGDEQEETGAQWSIDFDFSEEPIESHLFIEEIVKRYGGKKEDDGSISFDAKLPKGKDSSGLGGKKLAGGDKNPMYGVKSYAMMQARVSCTYSSKTINANLLNDVGKVLDSLPNAPDAFSALTPGDRNWLAQPPKVQQNGDVYRIEKEWLLSPPGGWPEEVYKLLDK